MRTNYPTKKTSKIRENLKQKGFYYVKNPKDIDPSNLLIVASRVVIFTRGIYKIINHLLKNTFFFPPGSCQLNSDDVLWGQQWERSQTEQMKCRSPKVSPLLLISFNKRTKSAYLRTIGWWLMKTVGTWSLFVQVKWILSQKFAVI